MTSLVPTIMLVIYLAMVVFIALRYGRLRREAGILSEFAVAGRGFPWWLIVFTVLGTWYTGDGFGAITGLAVFSGSWCLYMTFYSLIGIALFYFIAPRIWVWGKAHNLYTMPDYLRLRYDSKGIATIFAIVVTLLAAVWYVTAFRMLGYVMYEVTYHALPFNIAVFILPLFIMAYVLVGGMRSIVTTDFVQGLISTVLVIFGIIFVIQKLFGGMGPMFSQLVAEKPLEWLTVAGPNVWSSTVIACGLGAYCWIELFNRIFVAKSPKDLKMVARVAPIVIALFGIALAALALGGALLPEVTASQKAAESGILIMFSQAGGPVFLGFAAIIVIAASMSNIDSGFNAYSVVLVKNVIADNLKGGLSDAKIVLFSRILIVIGILAFSFLATIEKLPLIARLMITTYEFLLCTFPGIIIGIFWKRGSALATYASLAVGIPTVALLLIFPSWQVAFGGFGAGFIGGVFAVAAYAIVALSKPPTPRAEELFREVEEYKAIES